jgi:hypothetical protein
MPLPLQQALDDQAETALAIPTPPPARVPASTTENGDR